MAGPTWSTWSRRRWAPQGALLLAFGGQPLTTLSNMFTNLNLTDMETCYKMFRREVIQSIEIEEDRFGFEPEITAKVSARNLRIYETGISYSGRTYDEGKKIGWPGRCAGPAVHRALFADGHPLQAPRPALVRSRPLGGATVSRSSCRWGCRRRRSCAITPARSPTRKVPTRSRLPSA